MTNLPNPFDTGLARTAEPVEAAAPSSTTGTDDAAADYRFVLDEEAFLSAIEPLPAFLSAPSLEFLRATDLIPVLQTLAGH